MRYRRTMSTLYHQQDSYTYDMSTLYSYANDMSTFYSYTYDMSTLYHQAPTSVCRQVHTISSAVPTLSLHVLLTCHLALRCSIRELNGALLNGALLARCALFEWCFVSELCLVCEGLSGKIALETLRCLHFEMLSWRCYAFFALSCCSHWSILL